MRADDRDDPGGRLPFLVPEPRFKQEIVPYLVSRSSMRKPVTQVVDLFENHESYDFVLPDDKRISKDIFIPQSGFRVP